LDLEGLQENRLKIRLVNPPNPTPVFFESSDRSGVFVMKDSGYNKRKKVIDRDTIITWIIDGKTVKKSYNEGLKEVRSQAYQKTLPFLDL
jgi:hypothetical protein